MKIVTSYQKLLHSHSIRDGHPVFQGWNYTDSELKQWFTQISTQQMLDTAQTYLNEVEAIVNRVEAYFETTLPGELVLIPSMGDIDGFARYDRGHHTVMLGIDFPDASIEYLRALTAHELSHVYRDHSPAVWGFLGKPLGQVTRDEYLEATTGREHLISEGLATLASQAIYPEVPVHDHHYYDLDEMNWCFSNDVKINEALERCVKESDPDPWKFYRPGLVAKGSPSRTHYYWAAKRIQNWIQSTHGMTLLKAHALPADEIRAF